MLFRGNNCSTSSEPNIEIFATKTQAKNQYQAIPKSSLQNPDSRPEDSKITSVLDSINYEQEYGIAINLGNRPTPGYSVDSIENELEVKDNTVIAIIKINYPEKDAVLPQVITRPCAILSIDKGPYQTIDIIDSHGKFSYSALVK